MNPKKTIFSITAAILITGAVGFKFGSDYLQKTSVDSTKYILENQQKKLIKKSAQIADSILTSDSTPIQAISPEKEKVRNVIDLIHKPINQGGYNCFEKLWNRLVVSFKAIFSCKISSKENSSLPLLRKMGFVVLSGVCVYFLHQEWNRRRQQIHNDKQLKKIDKLSEQHAQIIKRQIDEDITKFQSKRNQLLKILIFSISEIDYIKPKNSKEKIVVIGQISAGKSSILKLLLKVQLQCGVGETTSKLESIYNNSKAEVYDAPGVNKQFDIFSSKVLKELFRMDTFIVCYQNCLSEVNHIIRVLSAISKKSKQHIYLVRTQCDRFKGSDALTIEEQLQVDRNYLKQLKQTDKNFDYDYEILTTSSRESLSYRDNKKLQDILKNLK